MACSHSQASQSVDPSIAVQVLDHTVFITLHDTKLVFIPHAITSRQCQGVPLMMLMVAKLPSGQCLLLTDP
jgi:hypothetical protein